MRKFLGFFLSFALLLQTAAPALAIDAPKKSFYEKSGWLDYQSNTLRRVAERGEAGAYQTYKNNNPAPRNQYEQANIHQANLNYLRQYQSDAVYRRANEIRNAFLSAGADAPGESEPAALTETDLMPVRAAVNELMGLYAKDGEKYPVLAQTVLQVSAALLPFNAQYAIFTPEQTALLKNLQKRVLNHTTHCSQGSGYRVFCEGRAEALYGLAILARTDEDAQTVARALIQDLKEPIAPLLLPSGFEVLLDLGRADLLENILSAAVEAEEQVSVIDLIFIRHWVDEIQNLKGRYLGKVSQAGRLAPAQKGKAEGNVWEELARMMAQAAPQQPAVKRLLEQYTLGSCAFELNPQVMRRGPESTRLSCRTIMPFLVGALDAGFISAASEAVQKEAARRKLTPGAYVANALFESVFGDLDAETEYRVDSLLHRVFAAEIRRLEELRRQAVKANAPFDEKIKTLSQKLAPYLTGEKSYFETPGGQMLPEGVRLSNEIAALESQKAAVPARPNPALQMYTRDSAVYRRKQIGQTVYKGAVWAAEAADFVWIGFLTGGIIKGASVIWYGVRAARAGQVTSDVRRLASLSARLRKVNMQGALRLQHSSAKQLSRQVAAAARETRAPGAALRGAPQTVGVKKPVGARAKQIKPSKPFTPKRSAATGRFPSGLDRDEELLRQWKESFNSGRFTPRDQVEAVAGMKPAQMNNIIEHIYYMQMPKAERVLMKPILRQGRLPRFMYEDRLIPRTKRLPHGYYKNRFNEKVERLVELARTEHSALKNHAELDNILTSMKDYTFTQGFGFPNTPELTRGLHANWKALTQEILMPGHAPNRTLMNQLWSKPVQYAPGKTVSLQQYFGQKVKTVFFSEKTPDFFINSPKWVELENVRRNLAAADYMKRFGKEAAQPWWERVQDWFVLGKRSDYITLEQFGKVMTDQYKRNPAVARALAEAESTPSSLTYKFNCHEGRACQAAITDGGAAYIPRGGYDGTRQMARFEPRTSRGVKAVVFEDGRYPRPRVVDLKSVSYVKDLHPSDADLIRAGKMVSDRVDETWDLLTIQQAGRTLPKIPDLKATIYPKTRLPGQTLPEDLTGGGVNAYLTLFTPDFYPVKTVYRLRWKGLKPVVQPQYYIRKEVPALSGSIHRERLTFLEQVADRVIPAQKP